MQEEHFGIVLSDSTAELIRRYGTFDEEGWLVTFHIINEEIIRAMEQAAEWLRSGFFSNERLSEVWAEENPCSVCAERVGCNITCRRKHAFDKEIYGALLCGRKHAAEIVERGGEEVENMVRFMVRLEENNTLIFFRDTPHPSGAINLDKNYAVTIDSTRPELRPWSAALYSMFVVHPEGFPLSHLGGELRSEFVRIYRTITKSDTKVATLKSRLKDPATLSHLLNNKLSELNAQLREAGVKPQFIPRTEQSKANNKPFFIPYLREK